MLTYLFCGEDVPSKDAKISELKNKYLTSPEALKFDYELLHAHKLEPENLKKAFISLPAVVSKRLIIIRECHRLNPQNKEIVLEFVGKKADYAVLILETDVLDPKDGFIKKLKPLVKSVNFTRGVKLDLHDLTRAISAQRSSEALKVLDQLISQGEHPLQILGGLVWFLGDSKRTFSKSQFEKGLLTLQEADLNIKRSRLEPDHALEVAVVKLCGKGVY